jgi:hypothetical protein
MYLYPNKNPAAMTADSFARRTIEPEDIIDGVKNLLPYDIRCMCTCVSDWVEASTYLDRAEQALLRASPEGYASAITHAKRAVCRTIDGLLLNRHLRAAMRQSYPEKLDILTYLGVGAPQIVYSYIIEPRNVEEHQYLAPDKSRAKVAVEMAQLFLAATAGAQGEGCVLFLGENLEPLLPVWPSFELDEAVCGGLPEEPFVCVDVFEDPPCIKVIIPEDQEILACELSSFSVEKSVELTRLLNNHRRLHPRGFFPTKRWTYQKDYLQRIKELSRI